MKKITLCLLTMKTEASKFSVGSIKIDVGWSDGSSNIFTIENIVSQYEKGSFFPNFMGENSQQRGDKIIYKYR